jgi:hypothetical protein
LDLPLRDLVDVAYRLLLLWACQDQAAQRQAEAIHKHFRDLETEYETGMPVLPGWAALGNVAANYGLDDADPFAVADEPIES